MPARSHADPWEASAPIFGALGDAMRMRLIARLCHEGPLSITRLTEETDISRQAVTKHLNVLAAAGVVNSTRLGRETVWELEPQRLATARRLLERISSEWDERIGRLRALVEDD